MPDSVIYTFGREVFTPIKYHSFEIGPLSITSELADNEDAAMAFKRCADLCETFVAQEFETKLNGYLARLDLAEKAAMAAGGEVRARESEARQMTLSEPVAKKAPKLLFGAEAKWTNEQTKPTGAQLRKIHALCKNIGLDLEQECRAIKGVDSIELSKKASSEFIDHLLIKEELMRSDLTNGTMPGFTGAVADVKEDLPVIDVNADLKEEPKIAEPKFKSVITDDDIPF